MLQNAHDSYLESRVLSADPIELIRMLYQSATRAVENARRHLAAGDIAARARSISHASAVVIELATSLDHERGGAISANLARLYDYLLRRLTEANLQQSDPPLAEVLALLGTLSEAWDGLKPQGESVPEAQGAETVSPTVEAEGSSAGSSVPPSSGESDAIYGSYWAQPASQETASSYGYSWEQPKSEEPAVAFGSAWGQPAQEPTPAFGSAWEKPGSEAPVTFGSVWEQPKSQKPAEPFGSSWEQPAPEAPISFGSPWKPSQSQETGAALGGHESPVSGIGPLSPGASSWTPLAAQELASAYGCSRTQQATEDLAAMYRGTESASSSPWQPASLEPATAYASSWAHLAPPENAVSYSSHDWSL